MNPSAVVGCVRQYLAEHSNHGVKPKIYQLNFEGLPPLDYKYAQQYQKNHLQPEN